MCSAKLWLLSCALALLLNVESVSGDELSELRQDLESIEPEVRAQAMRRFQGIGPGKFGAKALPLIKQGIQDQDEDVQVESIHALQRYAWSGKSKIEDPQLAENLLGIILEHSVVGAASEAANAYGFIYGITSALEEAVITRVDRKEDSPSLSILLGVLREAGVERRSSEEVLLRVIRWPPGETALTAWQVAANSDISRAYILAEAIRLAGTDEVFAHYQLIRFMKKNPDASRKYLPELYELRERLLFELRKDRSERTVTIPNDEFWRDELESAIRVLEAAGS